MRAMLEAIERTQAVVEFGPDGVVQRANAVFLALTGYEPRDVLGQHHMFFAGADGVRSDTDAAFWQRLREGAAESGVFLWRGRSGRQLWLQVAYTPVPDRKGRISRVVAYATDVTQEVAYTADLRQQLHAVDRSQGVVEFSMNGTILAVNQTYLRALDYRLDDVVGKHHSIFVDPEEAKTENYMAFWRHLRSGHHDSALYRRLGRNGRVVWIQATYTPIPDANGRPIKVVKYASEITAQAIAPERERRLFGADVAETMAAARAAPALL
ncbi:PAS domain S-box-containing protein [Luteibacter sp. Sphag1AF]|nr:PAS domain S-box-containing protein [Luteibacter sp. Sphag1AF]